MGTYISLVRYTDQGIRNIRESPQRLDAARKAFESMGGQLKHWYLAMSGRYDAVVISEFPDAETAERATLVIESLGSIRTEGFRVFTEDEYRKLIASLP